MGDQSKTKALDSTGPVAFMDESEYQKLRFFGGPVDRMVYKVRKSALHAEVLAHANDFAVNFMDGHESPPPSFVRVLYEKSSWFFNVGEGKRRWDFMVHSKSKSQTLGKMEIEMKVFLDHMFGDVSKDMKW